MSGQGGTLKQIPSAGKRTTGRCVAAENGGALLPAPVREGSIGHRWQRRCTRIADHCNAWRRPEGDAAWLRSAAPVGGRVAHIVAMVLTGPLTP